MICALVHEDGRFEQIRLNRGEENITLKGSVVDVGVVQGAAAVLVARASPRDDDPLHTWSLCSWPLQREVRGKILAIPCLGEEVSLVALMRSLPLCLLHARAGRLD